MLFDEKERLLFTGDTFYLGALYAHFNSMLLGKADIYQYRETMKRLTGLIPEIDWLVCSHNDLLVSPVYLQKAYEAFDDVLKGRAVPVQEDVGLHSHGQRKEESAPLQFQFDGFSIIVNREDLKARA